MRDARILVVDDQDDNVFLLRFMLEQEGFSNVHTLTDSRQVCSWCAEHQPDLILLDLLMPHLDGFGVMQQLEEHATPGEVAPILVLTADVALETRRRALAVGARDFVTKPFDHDEVLLRVKNLLRTRLTYRESQDQNQLLAARLRERADDLDRAETERRQLERELHRQAQYDALTGLPNRVLLLEQLQDGLLTVRQNDRSLALLLLDLNGFAEVNTSLGHACGDLLLQEVATRLRGVLQGTETVARLGGDEFAVLVPGANLSSAIWAARKILAALSRPFPLGDTRVHLETSIGLVLAPQHGVEAANLLRQADVARLAAKGSESGYAVYTAQHEQQSVNRVLLMSDLRQAIAQNQLTLAYQPKAHVRTGRTYGVEALARWTHPRLGVIPPDTFITLAEQTGVIMPLTQWVLETALAQCREWQQQGPPLNVAVNLSMRTLHDSQIPQVMAALLRQYNVAAECVTLEITESALMVDPERVQAVLTELSRLGLRTSIDDFGTGYSSLRYLSRLPVNEIKIDRSFVMEMVTHPGAGTIIRSIIDLGRNLGLEVVAEGVETLAEWQRLAEWGCDAVQGYYLSRPVTAADLEAWLRRSPYGITRDVA